MALQVWLPLNGDLHNQGLNQNVTATNHGAVVNDSGKIGKCYSFNGSNNYLSCNYNFYNNKYSVSAWIYSTSSTTTQTICCDRTTVGSGFSIFLIGGKIRIDSGGNNLQWTTNYTYPINTWFHLAVAYDGTNVLYYINGKYQEKKAQSISASYWGNIISIGASQANGSNYGNYLNGKLNDIRIYDHALSPKEVEDISKALILHYPLNDIYNDNLILNSDNLLSWSKENAAAITLQDDGFYYIRSTASSTTGRFGIYKDITLEENTTYTFSVYVKSRFHIGVTPGSSFAWNTTQNADFTNLDRYIYTFTTDSSNTKLRIYLYGYNRDNGETYVKLPKLEKGNVATRWCLSTASNTTIYDSSGYGNNGTIIGSASAAAGSPRYNNATYMDNTGTANHIECDKVITIPTDGITVSFWAYTDKTNSYVLYIDQNMSFAVSSGGTAFYVCRTSSAGFPKTEFKTGQWNHVVLIRNEDTYKAYINGKSIARNQSNNNWTHQVANIYLFNRKYNNSYAANAYMSDFRMYATELTEDQIQELYQTSMLVDASGNIIPRGLEEV